MNKPTKVIAIEEAFLTPEVAKHFPEQLNKMRNHVSRGLLGDVGEARIQRMDEDGIDLQVLSLVSPGVQDFKTSLGISLAKETNDWLGQIVKKYPTRFAGFACLPMQDVAASVNELKRSVQELGLKGALINGYTQGQFLDEKPCWEIFKTAQELKVPIYIHPRDIDPSVFNFYFKDYPELAGAAWGWAVDTGTQLLRLVYSGMFDRYPDVKVVVGHMGELIPFHMARINKAASGMQKMLGKSIEHDLFYYMRKNIFITCSGVFENASLSCALEMVGIDNLLFSVDDPFAINKVAVDFLKQAPLSKEDFEKFSYKNAERLLGL